MAAEIDITAFKHAPWGGETGDGDIVVWGQDWSGATFLWQFGSPTDLAEDISLGNASAGSEGVSATYSASYDHPTSGASGAATIIRPQINEATLEALSFTGQEDLALEHTLYVTPSGGIRRVLAYGSFTIKQGIADA